MHPLQWLSRRDRDLAALRRAGRAAIVMPATFAVGEKVIANPALATFAAFGSFAMLLLVDFSGPLRERVQAQAALVLAGCTFVLLGTLASQNVWLATACTLLVGFGVIFAGVVSSVLAGATTSLLLAFVLPVTLAGPVSSAPDRVAGWGMAGVASILAVGLLWPASTRGPLRSAATSACAALAGRLRAEVAHAIGGPGARAEEREQAVAQADQAIAVLHRGFLTMPYRPTSLSTAARTVIRLVDELSWLNAIVAAHGPVVKGTPVNRAACAVKLAAAEVLERGADLLELTGGDCAPLHAALGGLAEALQEMEKAVEPPAGDLISSLDPNFRAQELAFAVSAIGRDIDLTAAAERRSWLERVLGRQPQGLTGALSAAQRRASAHIDRHSVWLHNSVRGAVGLALAVFVANRTGVQHSFWVALGTLSVLRSNALSTGQNVVRGLAGTVAGVIAGAVMLVLIGTNTTLLWLLLPLAILLAGIAPAVISFAAGQAAFTLTLVFLFNIIQPAGWRIGLLRIEDIAIGCAVSLVVGLLFWPRGAGAALRRALADAYTDSADYLASAVDFGMRRCELSAASPAATIEERARASAAAGRLDDTFRNYLAERGAKPIPLAEITSLVNGVSGLRLAADAVLDLWQREDGSVPGDRAAAREEVLKASERVKHWYGELASSLLTRRDPLEPLEPLSHDKVADGRLLEAVRNDLRDEDGKASATAIRMIWTDDHLDAARRLQEVILAPARTVTEH